MLLVSIALPCIAAAALIASSSAAGQARSAVVECPVTAQTCCPPESTTTCCPTPTVQPCCTATPTTCCSGAAQTTCTVQVTIAASPNPLTAGRRVTISGHVSGMAAGAQVVLSQRVANQTTFHSLQTTTTNSSGVYTFTLKEGAVMTNRDWYATAGGVSSSTVTERVYAILTLAAAHRGVHRVRLSGNVSPSYAGQRLLIERLVAGHWRVIARPLVSSSSGFALTHRFARRGKAMLRAVLPAGTLNLASTSSTISVRIS